MRPLYLLAATLLLVLPAACSSSAPSEPPAAIGHCSRLAADSTCADFVRVNVSEGTPWAGRTETYFCEVPNVDMNAFMFDGTCGNLGEVTGSAPFDQTYCCRF